MGVSSRGGPETELPYADAGGPALVGRSIGRRLRISAAQVVLVVIDRVSYSGVAGLSGGGEDV